MEEILKNTSEQMRKQNNRGTQYPLFVIQDKIKVYGASDWKDEMERNSDSDQHCEDCSKIAEEKGELPDTCEEDDCGDDCFNHYSWEWQFDLRAGVFFTEEACNNHIKQNDYHYHKDVRSYVAGAWRNEEMVAVMQSVLKLTADDKKSIPHQMQLPSCYK